MEKTSFNAFLQCCQQSYSNSLPTNPFFLGRVNFYQNITCNKTANLVEKFRNFYGVYRMRSRLISVLQQSVQRSQKFADYNFRNYFVAKYATKLEQVETDKFGPITEEVLNKAEADLEMLIRQTTIQEIDHFKF